MAKGNPQFSETIGAFCNAVRNAKRDYEWNWEEVNRLDKLTQDYLHQLELNRIYRYRVLEDSDGDICE